MKKRGQGSIEFIIVLGVVLLFFVIFFGIIKMNQANKYEENEEKMFQNIVLDVRDEINIAAGSTDGYYREFQIPTNVYGKDYEINISSNGYVYLTSERYAVSYKASNVTGEVKKGPNIIRKENGTVYLN